MKRKIARIFFCSVLSSVSVFGAGYETYLESWDTNWNPVMTEVPANPSSDTTSYSNMRLNVCFASYTFPGLNGLQFSDASGDTATIIGYVHAQNGKVKISYGGASYAGPNYFISQTAGWPTNIPDLAAGVANVVNSYGFDGVDFDIEDPQPSNYTAAEFASQLFSFLTQVRAALPDKLISLTIPGQGWGTYWKDLAQQVSVAGTVDCINFMEYDIWVGTNTFPEQIEADLITYTSPTNSSPAPNYSPGWGISPAMIQLGLMPGNDDGGQFISVSDAQALTTNAVMMGLSGVMTWDLDRDSLGITPAAPYAYTSAIRSALRTALGFTNGRVFDVASLRTIYRSSDVRSRTVTSTFQRKNPPLHGAP